MKKSIFILLIACITLSTNAQTYLGLHYSNYDGLKSQLYNAGAPATTLTKWQVNLIGADISVNQTIFKLVGGIKDLISDFDRETSLTENTNVDNVNLNINADIQGPGFMFSNPKIGAISLQSRARLLTDVSGVSSDFITSIYNDIDNIYNWVDQMMTIT